MNAPLKSSENAWDRVASAFREILAGNGPVAVNGLTPEDQNLLYFGAITAVDLVEERDGAEEMEVAS